jgi:coenzyme F420-reducing hydrogenase beta subunit
LCLNGNSELIILLLNEEGRMVNKICEVSKCTGCLLCKLKCPQNCINCVEDSEGFQIPKIDENICINCGLCSKVCPVNSQIEQEPRKTYAVQLKDKSLLLNSASGGAFMAVAYSIIKDGGIVCGTVDNIEKGLNFQFASSYDELNLMAGSKYYQCNLLQDTYNSICDFVRIKKVLFVGTPCQVSAVKKAISREYSDNLYTIDILCQGVPSSFVVKKYRNFISKREGKKLVEHRFRCKDIDSHNEYITKLIFEDKMQKLFVGEDDIYSRSFQRKIFLREACYQCHFSGINREGDLTIGDFWGIKSVINRSIDLNGGVSLVISSSTKGDELINAISGMAFKEEKTLKEAVEYNLPLRQPVIRPKSRTFSYKLLNKIGINNTVNLLCWKYFAKKILRK